MIPSTCGSLVDVVSELKRICTNCEVGLTPKQRDMTFLGLDDFICSDFDSTVGQRHYPSRNCPLEDAAWAASPSSLTAPCCSNATLVRGSVAMMTESIAYGITELPLTRLLGGGSDPSYSSTEYFVNHYVETKAFILQARWFLILKASGVLRECFGSASGVLRECFGVLRGVLRSASECFGVLRMLPSRRSFSKRGLLSLPRSQPPPRARSTSASHLPQMNAGHERSLTTTVPDLAPRRS